MSIQEYLLYVVAPIISIAFIIIVIQFLKGPKIADRVVAIDLLITSGIGLIGIFSIYFDNANFLDVATILALIAFLSTIAFAYYLDQGNKNE
ncbi:MAG TPA: monovalent cation/H+ antiporter complex subunit F [Moheibacter sp.]|nr:monovalent cation/H+ antiporter complex subunit F [Moheibacter sp.]